MDKPEINPRKLLTKELMDKVEKRVRELLDLAAAIWPDHTAKFQDAPEIRYDIKNRFGGVAISGGRDDWTIRLNVILCYENEADFIHQTVGHEVAHLVQRVVFGSTKNVEDKKTGLKVMKKIRSHGPEWRSVMVKFDLIPAVTHKYDTSSIQTKKRPRSKRGAKLDLRQTLEMLKRLETGFRRLSAAAKRDFIARCEEVLEGAEELA
jgi:predicted SprT family Zn-dependent metalloprotease